MMRLPIDIINMIAEYVDVDDYETRTKFNRVVPFESRIVKKLYSDYHNQDLKLQLFDSKNSRATYTYEYRFSSYGGLMYLIDVPVYNRLLDYLVKTKDIVLFKVPGVRDYIDTTIKWFERGQYHVKTKQKHIRRCVYLISILKNKIAPIVVCDEDKKHYDEYVAPLKYRRSEFGVVIQVCDLSDVVMCRNRIKQGLNKLPPDMLALDRMNDIGGEYIEEEDTPVEEMPNTNYRFQYILHKFNTSNQDSEYDKIQLVLSKIEKIKEKTGLKNHANGIKELMLYFLRTEDTTIFQTKFFLTEIVMLFREYISDIVIINMSYYFCVDHIPLINRPTHKEIKGILRVCKKLKERLIYYGINM